MPSKIATAAMNISSVSEIHANRIYSDFDGLWNHSIDGQWTPEALNQLKVIISNAKNLCDSIAAFKKMRKTP